MREKFTNVIILSLLILSSVINAEEKALVMAAESEPPWAYIDNGQSVGIDVDIARAVAKEMGYRLVVKHLPTKRIPYTVARGEADFLFYSQPPNLSVSNNYDGLKLGGEAVYGMRISAFTLKDKQLDIDSLHDLYRYRIGHPAAMGGLEEVLLPGLTNSLQVVNYGRLVRMLVAGRVDVVIVDNATFVESAELLDVSHNTEVVYQFPSVLAIPAWSESFIADNAEIIQVFNKALIQLKARGDVAEIIDRYNNSDHFSDFGRPAAQQQ